ncbi:baseplate assembly protein [Yersinia frederiksenii]|nr:baseplate assembly protein [Yersinia frederiksenii]
MNVIDLSQLPAPLVVESRDYETLLAERKAAFIALYPLNEQDAVMQTLTLESEPITKLLQESTTVSWYCVNGLMRPHRR